MTEADLEFRPLKREDVKPFKMTGADKDLEGARQELGQSRNKVSWLWERWTFIEATTDPKLKMFFEEGKRNADLLLG